MDKTIIYYTSNREDPAFEQKIIDRLLGNCGDLPIISVSQKPMDLGHNICVGDVGHSYLNIYRQQLIGAKEAKTKYLVFAEADFLYPKEYFNFEPDGENVYLYDNIWILFKHVLWSFRKKSRSHGAQMVKRDYLIKRLEEGLKGMPEWFDGNPISWITKDQKNYATNPPFTSFSGDIPAVSFKTGNSINVATEVMKRNKEYIRHTLPGWGTTKQLRKEFSIPFVKYRSNKQTI